MKRYSKYIGWTVVILFVVIMLFFAFSPKVISVTASGITRGALQETLTAEGTTRYHDTYLVSAPISGLVTRTELEPGARVRENDALAFILPPQLDNRQVQELTSHLQSAEALEKAALNQFEVLKTVLSQAKREKSRGLALFAEHAITRDMYERDSDAVLQAQQDLYAAEARSHAAHHDAEAIRASLSGGVGGSTSVALISPVGGILLQVLEKDSREVPAGTPLFNVADTSRMEIVIDLLSSDAPRIHVGDSVMVMVPGIGSPLHARVRLIEPDAYIKVSPLGIEEKRVNVIAALQERPPELGATYRVEATMFLWSGTDILKVPLSALFRNGKDWYVYVIRNGKAREQKITLGHKNDTEAEVLSGLNQGDHVIVHPTNEIEEGVKVKM